MPLRRHARAQIGDRFGDLKVIALMLPENGRSDERVRVQCVGCNRTTDSYVANIRDGRKCRKPCRTQRLSLVPKVRAEELAPVVDAEQLEDEEEDNDDDFFALTLGAWSPAILVRGPDVETVVDTVDDDGMIVLGDVHNHSRRKDRATFQVAQRMNALYEQRLLERGWITKRTESSQSRARRLANPKSAEQTATALAKLVEAEEVLAKREKHMGKHDEQILAAIASGLHTSLEISKPLGITQDGTSANLRSLVDAGKVIATGVKSQRRYWLPGQVPENAPKPTKPIGIKPQSILVNPTIAKREKVEAARKRIADAAIAEQAEFARKPIASVAVLGVPLAFRVEVLGSIVECPTAASVVELLSLARAST